MRLHNQISHRDWSDTTLAGLPAGSGVLFDELTLDQRVGPEVVAVLIDPEPDELRAKKRLTLNLKAGIASTAHGPVLFLIWWIPPIVNGRPVAFYGQVMNPLFPKTAEVLGRLADQTHLHVLLPCETGELLTVFEYENTYGFDGICAGVRGARVAWPGPDEFQRAKTDYEEMYRIEDLFIGEAG